MSLIEFVLRRRQNSLKRGHGSLKAPPLASATRKEIDDSIFYSKKKLIDDNYKLLSVDIHLRKSNRRNLPPIPFAK